MKIIGLTGSIAAGKSTIAQMFIDLGLPVHDADKSVHQMLSAKGAAVPMVVACFGQAVLAEDDGIDRAELGKIVFSDPSARAQLEDIIHPLVYQARQHFLKNMHRARKPVAVLDVPLLFETGGDAGCDYVVTVWAPMRLLYQRALRRPKMTAEKFSQIIAAQLPQSEKIRLCDLALPTGLGRAESRRRLKKWLHNIR